MSSGWWAVVAPDGALVSVGTVVADPLPEGLAAVPTTWPAPGLVWDLGTRTWVPPEPAT